MRHSKTFLLTFVSRSSICSPSSLPPPLPPSLHHHLNHHYLCKVQVKQTSSKMEQKSPFLLDLRSEKNFFLHFHQNNCMPWIHWRIILLPHGQIDTFLLPFEVIDVDNFIVWSIIIHYRLPLWQSSGRYSVTSCYIRTRSICLPPIHDLMTSIERMPQFDCLQNDHLLRQKKVTKFLRDEEKEERCMFNVNTFMSCFVKCLWEEDVIDWRMKEGKKENQTATWICLITPCEQLFRETAANSSLFYLHLCV